MPQQLNTKPVRELTREMHADLAAVPGQVFSRQDAVRWFQSHYPNVKAGTVAAHLIKQSVNTRTRFQYSPRPDGSDDLFVKLSASEFRAFDPVQDAGLVVRKADPPDGPVEHEPDSEESGETAQAGSREFAYEHDLRDYLARNLHLLEPGLALYEDEGIKGIEFPAGGRFIDILAVDAQGNYVVIELKVSKG